MKIKVLSSKQTITLNGKKKTFYRYFSPCRIQVIDDNGEDLGICEKNINVSFTKDAGKKLPDEKVFAIFESSKPEDISLPYVWKKTKNPETGEDEYPRIWIRSWEKMTPVKPRVNNTCEPILEEDDTEEIEIEE